MTHPCNSCRGAEPRIGRRKPDDEQKKAVPRNTIGTEQKRGEQKGDGNMSALAPADSTFRRNFDISIEPGRGNRKLDVQISSHNIAPSAAE